MNSRPRYILPREVVYKIISYLDIDTRQSLGIYTKLKIPNYITNKISRSFKKINRVIVTDLFEREDIYYIDLKLKNEITPNEIIQYSYEIEHVITELGIYYSINYYAESINQHDDNQINFINNQDFESERYKNTISQPTIYYGYKNKNFVSDEDDESNTYINDDSKYYIAIENFKNKLIKE
jgi:hypothetical protein